MPRTHAAENAQRTASHPDRDLRTLEINTAEREREPNEQTNRPSPLLTYLYVKKDTTP